MEVKHKHKDIVIKKIDGELVVTSRQIAEDFDKRHADVIEKIEELIKTENSVMTMFIETSYKAGTGKSYKEYLITRDGFSLLVMGFTGLKALQWKLKYIEAFNKMEHALKEPQKQLTPIEMMELQFKILKEQGGRIDEVEEKVEVLSNSMTIDYGQQEVINRVAKERMVQVLGGKDTPAYRELSKKVFSNLWKRYKQVFHVASYKDTAKKDYEEAIKYIEEWKPSKEIGYMIAGANSQIQFNN
ncbi:MAG: ORF6C domain-containing protein [Peptostreptococcaceae bacterium]|nr:ORF6C domain-containing protein [Peptostreptococcaceae bacterium]